MAQGAAYYGMVRRGHGTRIAGGLARAHYLGVERAVAETAGHAAVCLLPAGIAAGQMVELTDRQFQLRIRQPVEFPLYTSSLRTADTPGTLVPIDPQLLRPLPPIRTVLTSGRRKSQAEVIPVTLHAQLSDIGTLELWCREATGDRQWQLQFDVRATAGTRVAETPRVAGGVTGEDSLDASTLDVCGRLIHETFTSTQAGRRAGRFNTTFGTGYRDAADGVAVRGAAPFLGGTDGRCCGPAAESGARSAVAQSGRLCLAARVRYGGG